MISKLLIFSMSAFLISCATTHPGKLGRTDAKENKLPLKISAKTIDDVENPSFQLIELTLENTSDNWVKIEKARCLIDNAGESKLSVVLGSDLKYWAEASANQLKQDQHNHEIMQASIIGIGAAASAVGGHNNNSALATAGSLAVLGTYGWAVSDAITASINAAERSEKVPDNHLYHSVSIPSKMFLRRWILLNVPTDAAVKTLSIELQSIDGQKEIYAFDM